MSAGPCPICARGRPLDVVAELDAIWVTAAEDAPLPGYACVVSKRHVVEPFELPAAELAAFWSESMLVARVLRDLFEPVKLNYEIHGNTIPHLHMHLFPRFRGDPFADGPIDARRCAFARSAEELRRLRQAIVEALPAGEESTGPVLEAVPG
jgi:diadenosine tetraphosphate (Ap4A) HIT family hydrolase